MSQPQRPIGFAVPDGHRTAERRSLAMHAAIADALTDAQLQRARQRVEVWRRDGSVDPIWVSGWAEVLSVPLPQVAERLRSPDPSMTQLRQSTPFAGVLPNKVRWQILRDVR